MENPVTLIVKTANQRIDDFTVHCSLNWTIRNLKDHLSESYPSKPKIENQRLIYYGHMLNDDATLREVLNKFGPNESTHTVHLVFKSTTVDKINEAVSPPSPNPTSTASSPFTTNTAGANPWFGNNPAAQNPMWSNQFNYNYFQQLAAQQAYLQFYRTQYMEMLARQQSGMQWSPNAYAFRSAQIPEQQRPQQQQQQQRVLNQEDEEGRPNRDWLDYAHVFSRLVVLFSIVYFYSSPARFLIVSFLGFFLYLYHVGFFRIPLPVDNNNDVLNGNLGVNNNNNNNNQNNNNNNNNVVQQEVPAAGAALNNQNVLGDNEERPLNVGAETGRVAAGVELQPSIVALTWTFLSSFFTSLIPDNQNEI